MVLSSAQYKTTFCKSVYTCLRNEPPRVSKFDRKYHLFTNIKTEKWDRNNFVV